MPDPRKDDIAEVADDIRMSKGLVLFLGAGVNSGTLLWPALLGALWEDAMKIGLSQMDQTDSTAGIAKWVYESDLFSIYEKASIVKILLGQERYYVVLRKAIYSQLKKGQSTLIDSLVGLCKSEWVKSVVTFNYDEYLEKKLDGSVKIPIRHVHGIVRDHAQAVPGGSGVVLSMDEYFHNMATPYSWQTTVQLHALTNATCLFVGTSLTDINMLRLLTYANNENRAGKVFALLAREEFEKKVTQELEKQPVKPEDLKGTTVDDWRKAAVRFTVRSKATLLNDFGVSAIFVDTFDQLPDWIDRFTGELTLRKGQQP